MVRVLLVLTLILGLTGPGCATHRPSYVRPDFEDVGDACDHAVEVGKVALLVAVVAACVGAAIYFDVQEDGSLDLDFSD